MTLRPYQLRAIDLVRAACREARSVVLVLPTGGGKTRTLAEIVARSVGRGKRALWLAHRGELIDQAAGALRAAGVGVGAVCASALTPADPEAPCQVASLQTLAARGDRPPADVLVLDEAHHAAARTYAEILGHYAGALRVGITATPERSDGRGLRPLFERLVVGATVRELTDAGHLVPARVIAPARRLSPGQIARSPLDAYREHAAGRRAIAYALNRAESRDHVAAFREAGIRAAHVDGETPLEERRAAFEALAAGGLDVVSNVHVATEGFDLPAVDCVILARGFATPGTYLQCVGRALRPAPGKADALILDLQGVTHDHGAPDEGRTYSLDGKAISRAGEEEVQQSYCRICGACATPGAPCSDCGAEPPEPKRLRVVSSPLVRYAAKRRESPEDKARTLARWQEIGRAKGYKPGWAVGRYYAVYGVWPPRGGGTR